MADFTFPPATVLVEESGEFAVGATGVLRATADGPALPIYDLNDSPISEIRVGPRGVHQAFKADVPDGLLDFGSTLFPSVSQESHRAGMQAIQIAEDSVARVDEAASVATAAAEQAASASVAAEQAAAVVVATPRFVLHGDDPDFPRPEEEVLPVIWVGSVRPENADTDRDEWVRAESWGAGSA